MKTAISIPDDIYLRAEALARRSRRSRSRLYSDALRSYLAQHDPDAVTAALDELVAKNELEIDPAIAAASRSVLERAEW